jgi:exopolysaccharide biosynthesis polyprenyl glycosylphosphotransferase
MAHAVEPAGVPVRGVVLVSWSRVSFAFRFLLGEQSVGPLFAAPVIAALVIAFFALLRVGPPAQIGTARAARSPRSAMPFALLREAAAGERADLSLVGVGDYAARIARASDAADGVGKRLFDVAAATGLLIFFAPLMLATAILIKMDSPGPVLYRQRRVGRSGRPFDILKFRSMVDHAEKDGAVWAASNDQRITRVGRIIRRLRIDEIPQAINVLRGEMSFVGPRPERPEFVEILEREIPNYQIRHSVRPGITGLAQVKYVYGASVEDARIKLQYDLHYIEHFSLWRDLVILLMTVRVALFGIGSR